jgi:hypothetical protein
MPAAFQDVHSQLYINLCIVTVCLDVTLCSLVDTIISEEPIASILTVQWTRLELDLTDSVLIVCYWYQKAPQIPWLPRTKFQGFAFHNIRTLALAAMTTSNPTKHTNLLTDISWRVCCFVWVWNLVCDWKEVLTAPSLYGRVGHNAACARDL